MSKEENIEITPVREYVTIKTEKGVVPVPALTHPKAPGLAVTMCAFGVFEVSHVPTGLKMTGRHERMGTALSHMSKFAIIATTHGFSWDELNQEQAAEKMKELADKEVPFDGYTITSGGKTKRGLIKDWMSTLTMYSFDSVLGEFPWEESNPIDDAFNCLETVTL